VWSSICCSCPASAAVCSSGCLNRYSIAPEETRQLHLQIMISACRMPAVGNFTKSLLRPRGFVVLRNVTLYRAFSTPTLNTPPSEGGSVPTAPPSPDEQAGSPLASSPKPLGARGRFKAALKQYGPVALVTYASLYGTSFLGFFAAAESMGADAVLAAMERVPGIGQWLSQMAAGLPPKATTGGVAWLCTEVTDPLRWPLAIWLTPRIARWRQARKQQAAAEVPHKGDKGPSS